MAATNTQKPTIATIPDCGEVLLLCFHQDGKRWRPVIYVGPPQEPNNAAELFVGEWRSSLRKAHLTGMNHYFQLYEDRYGFKHPEDLRRTAADGVLPANVMSFREGSMVSSYTCDELPPAFRGLDS